jgi:hypothetical protein
MTQRTERRTVPVEVVQDAPEDIGTDRPAITGQRRYLREQVGSYILPREREPGDLTGHHGRAVSTILQVTALLRAGPGRMYDQQSENGQGLPTFQYDHDSSPCHGLPAPPSEILKAAGGSQEFGQ